MTTSIHSRSTRMTQSGMTLIEMVVVIILIMVVLAAAAARVSGIFTKNIDTAMVSGIIEMAASIRGIDRRGLVHNIELSQAMIALDLVPTGFTVIGTRIYAPTIYDTGALYQVIPATAPKGGFRIDITVMRQARCVMVLTKISPAAEKIRINGADLVGPLAASAANATCLRVPANIRIFFTG